MLMLSIKGLLAENIMELHTAQCKNTKYFVKKINQICLAIKLLIYFKKLFENFFCARNQKKKFYFYKIL